MKVYLYKSINNGERSSRRRNRRQKMAIRMRRGYVCHQDTLNRIANLSQQSSSNDLINSFFNGF